MKQIDLREGARRQHRSLAVLAMIQTWIKNWDGIVFERDHLERLVGLVKFKEKRIEWLKEDLRDLFPFQQILESGQAVKKFEGIFLSRIDFTSYSPVESATIDGHIEGILKNGGPVLGVFELWPKLKVWKKRKLVQEGLGGLLPLLNSPANYDERLMHSFLELITGGQISPLAIFPKNETIDTLQ